MNLTKLEQAIYNRELSILVKELQRGIEIIDKALAKYANGGGRSGRLVTIQDHKNDAVDFDKWVNNLRIGQTTYYGGYALYPAKPEIADAPEFLRRAILDTAINEFMATVNSIDEIHHIAETSHNSNQ